MAMVGNEHLESFRAAALGDGTAGDNFWKQFPYDSGLRPGDYASVLKEGMQLLSECHQLDPQAYNDIHKGTPLYWLGVSAFQLNDFETAVFFFDAAVTEDIDAGANVVEIETPALKFITLDSVSQNHAALPLVESAEKVILSMVDKYNSMCEHSVNGKMLSIQNVRDNFLIPALSKPMLRSLATAFLSFFLEWEHRSLMIELRTGAGTNEPFFLHMFKGCVLFESLLRVRSTDTTHKQFKTLNGLLDDKCKNELNIQGDLNINKVVLADIVRDLASNDSSIRMAIEFTGKVRNTVGHSLSWTVPIDKEQYDSLVEMIALSCLHVIACLYRS